MNKFQIEFVSVTCRSFEVSLKSQQCKISILYTFHFLYYNLLHSSSSSRKRNKILDFKIDIESKQICSNGFCRRVCVMYTCSSKSMDQILMAMKRRIFFHIGKT